MNGAAIPPENMGMEPNSGAAGNQTSPDNYGQSRKRVEYMTFQSVSSDGIMELPRINAG
jgi:hypothetical protein